MQASLKLNTKNTEYVLLTISNLEDQALPPSKEASMQHDYLNDSNVLPHSSRSLTPESPTAGTTSPSPIASSSIVKNPSPYLHTLHAPRAALGSSGQSSNKKLCSNWRRIYYHARSHSEKPSANSPSSYSKKAEQYNVSRFSTQNMAIS